MDARHFDALVRAFGSPKSRRRLLAVLATLPLFGGLLDILDLAETEAKERRRRRKQRHKRHKDKGQRKRQAQQDCQPRSKAQICAGQCGEVRNRQTCGKQVDCGSCDCSPPCEACFTCQGSPGVPGTCVPQQAGTPCSDTATCTDGVLRPQSRCNGSGMCEAANPVSCDPYTRCDGNACATSCSSDEGCVAESFCQDGACVGDADDGTVCTHDGQCASGHCVEGVCCDTTCAGECVACTLPGLEGTCTPRPADTSCGADTTCQDGTLYPQSSCDGSGVCAPADPVSCAPYAGCDGSACATSCRQNSECINDFFCDNTQCLPQRVNGAACDHGGQCASGFCVDDVCCNSACDGECVVCNLSGDGTCTAVSNGTVCGSGAICCGGTCNNGTGCCNTAADCPGSGCLCNAGFCITPTVATLAQCGGRCDPGGAPVFTELCSAPVACPPCSCGSNCSARFGNGPAGESWYCASFNSTWACPGGLASDCPASNEGCFDVESHKVCKRICT